MSDKQKNGDYKVGYKQPPERWQFKPGQSGNPKGRPKGRKNLKTDLREELAELVEVKEGDRIRKITKQRALLKSLMARGIKGSDTAASKLFDLCIKAFGLGDEDGGDEAFTPEEREILAFIEARLQGKADTGQNAGAETDENGEARP